ncbi:hypothetical protein ACFX11_020900 [Malus domestica]
MPLWDRDRETEGEGDSERERGRGRSGDPRFCTVKERPRVSHRGLFDYISVRFHPHFFPSFSLPTLSHYPILSRPLTVSLWAYMNSMRSHHLLSAKRRRTEQIVCYSSPIISVCFLQLFVSGGFDVFLNLLINSDGEFNADGLDRFVKEVKLTECGLSYAVVAVMGPQSSGKRTLLNHLFGLSLGRWMLTVEGAKLQRVFGLPSVLAVSRAQLPWIWRGLMGGRGAR